MATQETIILPTPILFKLKGYNTEINYSQTSNGSQLSYTSQGKTLIFGQGDLRIEQTQVGQIVTVSLTQDPAAEILEFLTLIVPVVNLPPTFPKCEVLTTAIFMQTTRTKGQVQLNMPLCLAGTAELGDS